MSTEVAEPGEAPDVVDVLIAEYLDALDHGLAPSRHHWLQSHAEHAAELARFLDDLERLSPPGVAPDDRGDRPASQVAPSTDTSAVHSETVIWGSSEPPPESPKTREEHLPFSGLFGSYELLQTVARGGMGVVFKARHLKLNRVVALKMILAGQLADEQHVQRFQAEAKAAAKLDHSGIVQVHEVGQECGLHYFTMAFVEGKSLAEVLLDGPMAPREAARIMRELAAAIAYAHEQGIVHRDIKPANVLIDVQGQPKLTDFGLAKQIQGGHEMTGTGQILGTPSYMSPEQAHGDAMKVGPASDVYGLGALLYALLTGRPPFQGASPLETIQYVLSTDAPKPRVLNPGIPRDLETICLKCLHKAPGNRYGSAKALWDDLDRLLNRRPILARRTGVLERTFLWCRRHKALTLLYVVLFLAAVSASAVSAYLTHLLHESEGQRNAIASAEAKSKKDLWKAYLAQARATRMTGQPGQRFDALVAIRAALALPVPADRSLSELRNEAIAALCLPDIEVTKEWDGYPAVSAAFAIDAAFERYAHADKDGTVSVYRLADHALLFTLPGKGPCADYGGLEFSSDGRFLCVRSSELNLNFLWRIDVEPPVLKATHSAIDFSPDGTRLAVRNDADGALRILDAASLSEWRRFEGAARWVKSVVWNPVDLNQVLLAAGNSYRMLDLGTGEIGPVVTSSTTLGCLAWHPQGLKFAFSDASHSIQIRTPLTRSSANLTLVGHRVGGILAAFNHGGDMLVSTDWSGLWRVWDPRTGQQLLSLPADGHTLKFSPDDEQLAAHTGAGKVRLFRVASGKEFRTLVRPVSGKRSGYFEHYGILMHPNGRVAAVPVDEGFAIVDIEHCEELVVVPIRGEAPAAFESSGEALVSIGNQGLYRWPLRFSGAGPERLNVGPPQLLRPYTPGMFAQNEDGQVAAFAYGAGALIWRPRENRSLHIARDQSEVGRCCVSPDGRWVATGSNELRHGVGAKVWDSATGKLEADLPVGRICRVWFSPDGKWLVTSGGGFRLWEVGSWREGPRIPDANLGDACAFSPDSRWLALCGKPGVVRIIDPGTGLDLMRLTAPVQTRLYPKCFTPDGGKLIALGVDTGTLHIFDLRLIYSQLSALNLGWDGEAANGSPPSGRSPRPLEVHIELGKIFTDQLVGEARARVLAKDYAQAISLLRQAIQTEPGHAEAHNNLAWLLLTAPANYRDSSQALIHARKANELSASSPLYANTYGVALYRNGNFLEAIRVLEKNLEASDGTQDAFDLYFLAMSYHRLGDAAKGKEYEDRAGKWFQARRSKLPPAWVKELTEFEAETRAVLAKPATPPKSKDP